MIMISRFKVFQINGSKQQACFKLRARKIALEKRVVRCFNVFWDLQHSRYKTANPILQSKRNSEKYDEPPKEATKFHCR